MAGGGAELFQSLGVKPIVGAFFNAEKSMPVLTEKLIYFGPVVEKVLIMDYYLSHSAWVADYVVKQGFTQASPLGTNRPILLWIMCFSCS